VVIISTTALLVAIVPVISQVVLGHPVLLTPYDPNGISTDYSQAPSLKHLLGTDKLGLDIFSRVLAALPLDLAIGVGIAGFALLLGGGLGLVAGYWDKPRTLGGVISAVILRVTDVFLAFPSLVLALAIAASLGRGTGPSILAVLLTWWPYYVRLTRGDVLAPGAAIFITVLAFSLFGDGLRDILDPRSRRTLVQAVAATTLPGQVAGAAEA